MNGKNSFERLERLPAKLLHGGDYNPEQWLDRPDILKQDIDYMKAAHINVVTLGVFSWSVYEPEEGEYYFEWLDAIMDRLEESGIYVILATPSGARPAWLDEKYPEVMRVNEYGLRNTHGIRHNHCMSSPIYRRKVTEMNEKLALRYGRHPALILWHVSNELGGSCYCELCRERFRQFLEERYHTVERLNQEWWTTFWSHRFGNFTQIDPPSPRGESSIHGLNLDWKRFTTWNMTDYMKSEIEVLRRITPDIPVTTNFMRLYKGLDYHRMAPELDIVSWDSYPAWGKQGETLWDTFAQTAFEHSVMRSMKPDRPYLLMESTPSIVNWHQTNKLKRPGIHRLSSLQAIACGADSVLYFQWRKARGSFEQHHGAVIDHLGTNDTRVYREVSQLGEELMKLDQLCGSTAHNDVAVLYDWENRWAIEDMAGLSDRKRYDETVQEIYRVLLRHGIDSDLVSEETEFGRYKVVIAPMLYLLKPQTASFMKKFTEAGGVLLATYMSGYVNENTLCYLGGFPGDGLREVFGLYSEEIDSLYADETNGAVFKDGGDNACEIRDFCEIVKVQDAEIMAVYTQDFYAGEPVLTRKVWGEGQAWYLAARMDEAGMSSVLRRVCEAGGLEWERLPTGLEVHYRYKEGVRYTIALNTAREKIIYKKRLIEALDAVVWEEEISDADVKGNR